MIRIVCIDDHAVVREGLAMFLGSQNGMHVVGAYDSITNLIQSTTGIPEFEVALVDVLMPGSPGPLVVQQLMRLRPGVCIIALTSSTDQIHRNEMLRSGARAYLSKSLTGKELVSEIHRALAQENSSERSFEMDTVSTKHGLTSRESDVLSLVAEGLSNLEIASHLCIAETTVKTHISSLLVKLCVDSRSRLVAEVWKSSIR